MEEFLLTADPSRVLIGALVWTAAAWAVLAAARRLAPCLAPLVRSSSAESWLRAFVLAMAGMVVPVAALGLAGLLNAWTVAATAAGLYLLSRRLAPVAVSPRVPVWPVALSCLLLAVDLAVYLPATANGWDAMTYHLYFPARWLQEGRLLHVPAVFSDNAAAFAPQNGALFFAWQMALSGRDALVDVSQVLALALAALALYVICRRLRVAREPAALAAVTLWWLAPVRRWTWSANVDVLMVACWLAAVAWQLRHAERPRAGTAALAGLAGGLAAGTKTLGLPLVALTAGPWLLRLAWRRRWRQLAAWLAGALIGGGWWYLRNAWLYGNPLFPLAVRLGPLRLAGAYDSEAVRAGEFHLDPPAAVAAVARTFGPVPCLLLVVGIAVLAGRALLDARHAARRPARRRRALRAALLAALAVTWAVVYVFAVPHNSQTRFLLPTLALSLAGWAYVLSGSARPGRWAGRGLWLLAIAAASVTAPPWRGWRANLSTVAEAGVGVGTWLMASAAGTVLAGAAFLLASRAGKGRRARLWTAAGAVLVAVLIAVATFHADGSRAAFLARADFADWRDGYLPFQSPAAPPLNIAYTGANVPYALMGSGWRHRVTYVNTQGEAGDGFYDFWRRDPRTWPYHKPGIYRGRDDEALWLDRLAAARVDVLVIFRLHPAERRYLASTPDGFPIEQLWARRHRERFEPVFAGPAAEIYRVVGVKPRGRSPGSSP